MTTLAGTYELGPELARGGMGVVLLATDVETGRLVVVKRIHDHLAEDPELRVLFEDEARLLPLLVHPNIVRVLAVLRKPGAMAIVLEHVPGANLRSLLRAAMARKQPPPPALIATIIARACRGLAAAHGARDARGAPLNVVHRDISPDNVLVSKDGAVKLSDFGIAHAEARGSHTGPGVMRGNVRFMAPEQLADQPVDARADLWAMGATLFESLAGAPAYAQDNHGALLNAILNGPIPEVREHRADVPEAYGDVIARCLVKAPAGRIESAAALADALEDAVAAEGAKISDAEIGAWVRDLVPTSMMDYAPTPGDELSIDTDGKIERKGVPEIERRLLAVEAPPGAPYSTATTGPIELLRELGPRSSASGVASAHLGAADLAEAPRRGLSGTLGRALVVLVALGAVVAAGVGARALRLRLAAEAEQARLVVERALEAARAGKPELTPLPGSPPTSPAPRRRPLPPRSTPPFHLFIDSEPTEAVLWLEGRELGSTPWGGDVLIERPQKLQVRKPGYQTKEIDLTPGVEHVETVTLKRAAPRGPR